MPPADPSGPETPAALVEKARALARAGDLDGSISVYGRALALEEARAASPDVDKEKAAILGERGWLQAYAGDRAPGGDRARFEAALADFGLATKLLPTEPRLWYELAICKERLGDLAGCVAGLSKVIELAPASPDGWHARGVTFLNGRDWVRANADLTKAIELGSKSALVWKQRGAARAWRGDWKGAAEDCTKALEVRATDASCQTPSFEGNAHFARARARWTVGELDGAVEDYEKFLELLPQSPDAARARGELAQLQMSRGGKGRGQAPRPRETPQASDP